MGRINAFQQAVDDATKSREKIEAFRTKPPAVLTGPMINSEEVQKETLKHKISAFETAAKFKGKVELKKPWRRAPGAHGNYNAGHRLMMDNKPAKPPPKKRITDLP